MRYVMLEYTEPQEDEARQVYSELDRENMETRRVELYPNGLWFAYGDEHGRERGTEPRSLSGGYPGTDRPRQGDGPDHCSRRVPGGLGPGGGAARRVYGHVFLRGQPWNNARFVSQGAAFGAWRRCTAPCPA